MHNAAGSPIIINNVIIDKSACDSLSNYINEKKGWAIKGDGKNGFCPNGNKNCNINDASGYRLWIITKKAAINPYYYAPDFFETCCPDEERGLFLSITKKIAAIVGDKNAEE